MTDYELTHEVHTGNTVHKFVGFSQLDKLSQFNSQKHLLLVIESEDTIENYLIDRNDPALGVKELRRYFKMMWEDDRLAWQVFDYNDSAARSIMKGAPWTTKQ